MYKVYDRILCFGLIQSKLIGHKDKSDYVYMATSFSFLRYDLGSNTMIVEGPTRFQNKGK